MVEIISNLKGVKTFLICRKKKKKKEDGNDITVDVAVAQRENSSIKCYASAFSNI